MYSLSYSAKSVLQVNNNFDFTEHWNKQITKDIDLYFIHWEEFKAQVVVYIVLACTVFGFLQGWEWAGIWKSTSKFPSFDLFHQLQRLLYQKTKKDENKIYRKSIFD